MRSPRRPRLRLSTSLDGPIHRFAHAPPPRTTERRKTAKVIRQP
ncbi:MAG TPA: hypothetical protein VF618_18980 [Thermoanaerobaculia bacterium]